MLRQIRYFQAVVRLKSFSEAAAECYISQSAMSQQIRSLEDRLGFDLLIRKNRSFELTPAGRLFYSRSFAITEEFRLLKEECLRVARGRDAQLRIGYLRGYAGSEFHRALAAFTAQHPDVSLSIRPGNHEELYRMLSGGEVDIALNDQRRTFSDAYVNLVLSSRACVAEVPQGNALSELPFLTPQDVKNVPVILVASEAEQQTEEEYCRDIAGFGSTFVFAESLEEARILVAGGRGIFFAEGAELSGASGGIVRVQLFRDGNPVTRRYCAFRKKDNANEAAAAFSRLLKAEFPENSA